MNIKDAQELKSLETRYKKLLAECDVLQKDISEIEEEMDKKANQATSLSKQIQKLKDKNKDIIVSEHALLRYLERSMNIDLDDVRDKILTDEIKDLVEALGDSGTYPINGSNCRAKIVDRTIVTVLDK